jgi:hypothetical protein
MAARRLAIVALVAIIAGHERMAYLVYQIQNTLAEGR